VPPPPDLYLSALSEKGWRDLIIALTPKSWSCLSRGTSWITPNPNYFKSEPARSFFPVHSLGRSALQGAASYRLEPLSCLFFPPLPCLWSLGSSWTRDLVKWLRCSSSVGILNFATSSVSDSFSTRPFFLSREGDAEFLLCFSVPPLSFSSASSGPRENLTTHSLLPSCSARNPYLH